MHVASRSGCPRVCSGVSTPRSIYPSSGVCWTPKQATAALPAAASGVGDAVSAKSELLSAIRYTNRGSRAGRFQRGRIEELQVAVESHKASQDIDFQKLGGLWLLEYTTAADVLPILDIDTSLSNPFGPSPVQVGNIYQRFTSPVNGSGSVDNVIQLSVPFLLEERKGVTFTVEASYEVRSGHRISLTFNAANVGKVRISEGFEALIAPAILPRTSLQHMVLLAFKQFELRFPFRSAAQVVSGMSSGARGLTSAGGAYQLTYLDDDMLIGRAVALGGTFIFTREL